MKQKIYVDIKLYDENLRTIFKKSHCGAENTLREVDQIIKKKFRGI